MLSRALVAFALSFTPLALGQALQAPPPENLLKNPSFEEPGIQGKVPAAQGGNPAKADEAKTFWSDFQVHKLDKAGEGKLTLGLTSEFARTGKQSMFVELDKVSGVNRRSHLMSDIVPVKPANTYRVSIWGRTDKKHPLTLDQRLLMMRVECEFFTPDTENQSGETENRTIMVPGNSKRIFFVSNQWTEYITAVRAPRSAGWMKVTFRWDTGREKGVTDGTIYFDDASVSLIPGGESLIPVDESDVAKPEPDESEAETTVTPVTPGTPSAPPKKQ